MPSRHAALSHAAMPRRTRRRPQGTTMSSELIKHTTDATFEADVLKSEALVLVDYWAEW